MMRDKTDLTLLLAFLLFVSLVSLLSLLSVLFSPTTSHSEFWENYPFFIRLSYRSSSEKKNVECFSS